MGIQSYGTARFFAFIGFIFYILAATAGVFALLILSVVASIASSVPTAGSAVSFSIVGFIPLIFGILFIPSIVLAFFAWTTIKAIDRGNCLRARTNSLIVTSIVCLVFGVYRWRLLPPRLRQSRSNTTATFSAVNSAVLHALRKSRTPKRAVLPTLRKRTIILKT